MTKHIIYSALILLLAFSACKSKKEGQTASQSNCKVLVNFASRGTGIDYGKYEKLTGLLNEKKLKFTEKVKGREGEKELCIPLKELKGDEKTKFIEQLKTFVDEATLVSVSVN
jgi:hypothetical protein